MVLVSAGQELLFPGLSLRVHTLEKLISAIVSLQFVLSTVVFGMRGKVFHVQIGIGKCFNDFFCISILDIKLSGKLFINCQNELLFGE